MNDLYVGIITGCHGITGELKILSDFEYKERVFTKGFSLIIDGIMHKITSVRIHKNFFLITIDDLYDINKVNYLINKDVYIKRSDLPLSGGEYLLSDLMGAKVYDNNESLGIITDIVLGKANNFVKVDNSFLIPLINEYIDHFDEKSNILYTKNGKSLKIL